ncbi:flagellar hook assembly protein FlgD [Tardiphaga sp. 862_B3_N4_1]|uniref:flagellar hook assembly protein FlgD n=1 Tax=Tardiphaga sp. 862_B3_N4_1 TaxID=3240764 RepID=UPI003F28852E
MTVAATTSTTTTTASTASSSSVTSAITSQQFLNLLVTELQNQNPLDPTNSTDFINQLTSYANFDQQQTLNSNMGTLVSSLNSLLTLNSSNYIGQTVTAKTDTGTLKDGQISFGYSLESATSDVTLSVKDSSGNTVWTGSGTTTSGTNSFTWDGTATDGTQLTDGGQYTLNVSATDSTGQSVYGYTTVTGKVTSINNSSGTPMLNIGSTSVSTSNVIGVTS